MALVLMPHDDARFIRECNWPYDHGRWSRGYPYCFSVRWPHHIVDAIEGISAMHNCNGRRPGIRSSRDGRPYPPKIYFTHGRDRLLTISVYERLRKQNELNANDQKIRKKHQKAPCPSPLKAPTPAARHKMMRSRLFPPTMTRQRVRFAYTNFGHRWPMAARRVVT